MPKTDVLLVVVSDFHSGSNYALFQEKKWTGKKGHTHFANSAQLNIRKRFEQFCSEVAKARQGRQVVLVHNGDAIDGDHHNSGDVCTQNVTDQADIHIRIMRELQRRIKWQKGDLLYYTRGTQSHVNENEDYIGKELNSIPVDPHAPEDERLYCHDLLELDINGVTAWFVHHGAGRGDGSNEGNALRNWLRNIQVEAVKDGAKCPDIVFTGHVHSPTYSTYIHQHKMQFKTLHGVILPSWQVKTRYALQVAPVARNKIGGVYQEIKADGTICVPNFSVTIDSAKDYIPSSLDDLIE